MIVICFNAESERVLRSLPGNLQFCIEENQKKIDGLVRLFNPRAVATSGFRCPCYNSGLPNSKKDSFHVWGCARDYSKESIKNTRVPGLKTIVEKGCIHFEFE